MKKQDLYKQVERAQSGDREALEIICRELREEVKGTLSRIIKDPELVEDLSQETYLRLIKSIRNIRDPVKIRNFVAKMALFVLNDYFRHKAKWKEVFIQEDAHLTDWQRLYFETDGDDGNGQLFNKITVEEVLNKIPELGNRSLIELKLQGKTFKEISRELSISEGAAKMRFKRTVEFLKEKLED